MVSKDSTSILVIDIIALCAVCLFRVRLKRPNSFQHFLVDENYFTANFDDPNNPSISIKRAVISDKGDYSCEIFNTNLVSKELLSSVSVLCK